MSVNICDMFCWSVNRTNCIVALVIAATFLFPCEGAEISDMEHKDDDIANRNPCNDSADGMHNRKAWLYVGYSILVVGTVGHLLSIGFLLHAAAGLHASLTGKCKKKRRFLLPPIARYLLPMSFCGLTALYAGLLQRLVKKQTCGTVDLHGSAADGVMEDFKCRFAGALEYYSIQLYAWLATCVAIERACAMLAPYSYVRMFGGDRRSRWSVATIAVCSCALILLALNAIPFVSYGVNEEGECLNDNAHLMYVYTYVDCFAYSILPLAIMTPCNALVLWRLGCCMRLRQGAADDRRLKTGASGATERRAMPLAVASVCLNVTLFLTVAQVSVELGENQIEDDNGGAQGHRLVEYPGQNSIYSTVVNASYNGSRDQDDYHLRMLSRTLRYCASSLDHFRELQKQHYDEDDGNQSDAGYNGNNYSSAAVAVNSSYEIDYNYDEWRQQMMQKLLWRTQISLWRLQKLLRPYGVLSLVHQAGHTTSSVQDSVNSSHSDTNDNDEWRQPRLHELHWNLGQMVERSIQLQAQSSDEAPVEEDVVSTSAWSMGMLATYLFCSGSFYVYLAVSVAFRQSAKQMLRTATEALVIRANLTTKVAPALVVLSSESAPAVRSCATATTQESDAMMTSTADASSTLFTVKAHSADSSDF